MDIEREKIIADIGIHIALTVDNPKGHEWIKTINEMCDEHTALTEERNALSEMYDDIASKLSLAQYERDSAIARLKVSDAVLEEISRMGIICHLSGYGVIEMARERAKAKENPNE